MDAVLLRPGGTEQASLDAIRAGADLVMICHTLSRQVGALDLVQKAVENDELSIKRVKESRRRIETIKDRFVGTWESWEQEFSPDEVDRERWEVAKDASDGVAREGYARSITVSPSCIFYSMGSC